MHLLNFMTMRQMTRKKKKYNPMKGALAGAKVGLKNTAVFHSRKNEGDKYTCIVIDYMTARKLTVGRSMAFAIGEIRHKWNIHLIAVGVESNGKSRFEVDEVPITEPLLQSQLEEYLNWRHEELISEFEQRNQLTNAVWLAVPNGDSITNEQIDAILTRYDGW